VSCAAGVSMSVPEEALKTENLSLTALSVSDEVSALCFAFAMQTKCSVVK